MAGFEDLIRGALEKQGAPTPERRMAVYESSRAALRRMLEQNTALDDGTRQAQVDRLEAAIARIETGYAASDPTPTEPAAPVITEPEAPVVAATVPASTPRVEPTVAPTPVPDPDPAPMPMPELAAPPPPPPPPPPAPVTVEPARTEPVFLDETLEDAPDDGDTGPVVIPSDYRGSALQERKPYAKLLLWTIILVGLAVAGWWAWTFGPGLLREQLEGSVPNPRPAIEQGAFDPGTEDGWVVVFDPSQDAGALETGGKGRAELFQSNDGMYARLTSNAGSSRNRLKLRVPPGVLEPLRGKAATFELMARNPEGGEQQFAIFCNFASMGSCGRKRFQASGKVEAYIFEMLVNDTTLPADETAWLELTTDLGGNGSALDVYMVRVRPGA